MTTSSSRPEDTPAALVAGVETTAAKRVRRYTARRRRRTPTLEPRGLDVAALAARYGGLVSGGAALRDAQNTTQVRVGVFRVPIGVSWDRWTRYRDHAAERFLRALDQQGWQVERLEARPGVYPYRDPLTGLDDPDYREMQLVAVCGLRTSPEPVVIALEPEEIAPS